MSQRFSPGYQAGLVGPCYSYEGDIEMGSVLPRRSESWKRNSCLESQRQRQKQDVALDRRTWWHMAAMLFSMLSVGFGYGGGAARPSFAMPAGHKEQAVGKFVMMVADGPLGRVFVDQLALVAVQIRLLGHRRRHSHHNHSPSRRRRNSAFSPPPTFEFLFGSHLLCM